ncbi:hypothetical protein GPECTOR_8g219 [Gonium pectorale]|uniref:Uncharacterized protein n=1 Tax=Gonium pectorale TaxID=33097 RepID=A0A150GSK3_GONPE|nr:hypothetical protein GPECTOR_8g219 [Gonium pectorale]|eukprot:KXZ52836.1 hypothetical protein GPECTOR_8g219 [Gonium pectorale]
MAGAGGWQGARRAAAAGAAGAPTTASVAEPAHAAGGSPSWAAGVAGGGPGGDWSLGAEGAGAGGAGAAAATAAASGKELAGPGGNGEAAPLRALRVCVAVPLRLQFGGPTLEPERSRALAREFNRRLLEALSPTAPSPPPPAAPPRLGGSLAVSLGRLQLEVRGGQEDTRALVPAPAALAAALAQLPALMELSLAWPRIEGAHLAAVVGISGLRSLALADEYDGSDGWLAASHSVASLLAQSSAAGSGGPGDGDGDGGDAVTAAVEASGSLPEGPGPWASAAAKDLLSFLRAPLEQLPREWHVGLMAAPAWLPRLRSLRLLMPLGDATAERLAAAWPRLAALQYSGVGWRGLGPRGLAALGSAQRVASGGDGGAVPAADDAEPRAAGPMLPPRLELLSLKFCRWRVEGVSLLEALGRCSSLLELRLAWALPASSQQQQPGKGSRSGAGDDAGAGAGEAAAASAASPKSPAGNDDSGLHGGSGGAAGRAGLRSAAGGRCGYGPQGWGAGAWLELGGRLRYLERLELGCWAAEVAEESEEEEVEGEGGDEAEEEPTSKSGKRLAVHTPAFAVKGGAGGAFNAAVEGAAQAKAWGPEVGDGTDDSGSGCGPPGWLLGALASWKHLRQLQISAQAQGGWGDEVDWALLAGLSGLVGLALHGLTRGLELHVDNTADLWEQLRRADALLADGEAGREPGAAAGPAPHPPSGAAAGQPGAGGGAGSADAAECGLGGAGTAAQVGGGDGEGTGAGAEQGDGPAEEEEEEHDPELLEALAALEAEVAAEEEAAA